MIIEGRGEGRDPGSRKERGRKTPWEQTLLLLVHFTRSLAAKKARREKLCVVFAEKDNGRSNKCHQGRSEDKGIYLPQFEL